MVYIFGPVSEHTVDQAGLLGGHGLDGDWGIQSSSESTELRSKITLTCSQVVGRELQGDGDPIAGRQPPFSNDSVSADPIVWSESQPGNKMIFILPFGHVPSRFADNRSRGHDIDTIDLG